MPLFHPSQAYAYKRGIDVGACVQAYSQLKALEAGEAYKRLTPKREQFVTDAIFPILGRRFLEPNAGQFMPCSWPATGCLQLKTSDVVPKGHQGLPPPDLQIRFSRRRDEKIKVIRVPDQGVRVLEVPDGFKFDGKTPVEVEKEVHDALARWTLGTELQPYVVSAAARDARVAHGEPEIFLKLAQKHVRTVGTSFVKANRSKRDRILVVGNTSLGKTDGLTHAMTENITKQSKRGDKKGKLTIAFTDQKPLAKQLENDIVEASLRDLDDKTLPTVIRWDSDADPTDSNVARTVDELMDQVEAADGPVVLVSTYQSWNSKMTAAIPPAPAKAGKPARKGYKAYLKHGQKDGKGMPLKGKNRPPANLDMIDSPILDRLNDNVSMILNDEAHHLGAHTYARAVEGLMGEGSMAKMYATTATPIHEEVDIVNDLFEGSVFWANLDNPSAFTARGHQAKRSIQDMITQLRVGIDRGETTPLHTYFIDQNSFDVRGQSIFKKDPFSNRYKLDQDLMPKLWETNAPFLKRHNYGIVRVGSIDEADQLLKEFYRAKSNGLDIGLANGREKRVEVLHSKLDEADWTHPAGKQKFSGEEIERQFKEGEINFLIVVDKMGEGINAKDASLLLDFSHTLNPKRLIQRMGRTGRISTGKEYSEVVTLLKVDEDLTREQLEFLEEYFKNEDALAGNYGTGSWFDYDDEAEELRKAIQATKGRIIRHEFFTRAVGEIPDEIISRFEELEAFVRGGRRLPRISGGDEEKALYGFLMGLIEPGPAQDWDALTHLPVAVRSHINTKWLINKDPTGLGAADRKKLLKKLEITEAQRVAEANLAPRTIVAQVPEKLSAAGVLMKERVLAFWNKYGRPPDPGGSEEERKFFAWLERVKGDSHFPQNTDKDIHIPIRAKRVLGILEPHEDEILAIARFVRENIGEIPHPDFSSRAFYLPGVPQVAGNDLRGWFRQRLGVGDVTLLRLPEDVQTFFDTDPAFQRDWWRFLRKAAENSRIRPGESRPRR